MTAVDLYYGDLAHLRRACTILLVTELSFYFRPEFTMVINVFLTGDGSVLRGLLLFFSAPAAACTIVILANFSPPAAL